MSTLTVDRKFRGSVLRSSIETDAKFRCHADYGHVDRNQDRFHMINSFNEYSLM